MDNSTTCKHCGVAIAPKSWCKNCVTDIMVELTNRLAEAEQHRSKPVMDMFANRKNRWVGFMSNSRLQKVLYQVLMTLRETTAIIERRQDHHDALYEQGDM